MCCADGQVDGERVPAGDGHQVRGVEGVDVEYGELEEHAELGGEAGEVLVDELQLERVVRRRRDQCGDLERRCRAALRELLHQRRPLLAHADVEVEHVDAACAEEPVGRLSIGGERKAQSLLEVEGRAEEWRPGRGGGGEPIIEPRQYLARASGVPGVGAARRLEELVYRRLGLPGVGRKEGSKGSGSGCTAPTSAPATCCRGRRQ